MYVMNFPPGKADQALPVLTLAWKYHDGNTYPPLSPITSLFAVIADNFFEKASDVII